MYWNFDAANADTRLLQHPFDEMNGGMEHLLRYRAPGKRPSLVPVGRLLHLGEQAYLSGRMDTEDLRDWHVRIVDLLVQDGIRWPWAVVKRGFEFGVEAYRQGAIQDCRFFPYWHHDVMSSLPVDVRVPLVQGSLAFCEQLYQDKRIGAVDRIDWYGTVMMALEAKDRLPFVKAELDLVVQAEQAGDLCAVASLMHKTRLIDKFPATDQCDAARRANVWGSVQDALRTLTSPDTWTMECLQGVFALPLVPPAGALKDLVISPPLGEERDVCVVFNRLQAPDGSPFVATYMLGARSVCQTLEHVRGKAERDPGFRADSQAYASFLRPFAGPR